MSHCILGILPSRQAKTACVTGQAWQDFVTSQTEALRTVPALVSPRRSASVRWPDMKYHDSKPNSKLTLLVPRLRLARIAERDCGFSHFQSAAGPMKRFDEKTYSGSAVSSLNPRRATHRGNTGRSSVDLPRAAAYQWRRSSRRITSWQGGNLPADAHPRIRKSIRTIQNKV